MAQPVLTNTSRPRSAVAGRPVEPGQAVAPARRGRPRRPPSRAARSGCDSASQVGPGRAVGPRRLPAGRPPRARAIRSRIAAPSLPSGMRPRARTRATSRSPSSRLALPRRQRLQGVEAEADGRPLRRGQALQELRPVGGLGVPCEHAEDRVVEARAAPERPQHGERPLRGAGCRPARPGLRSRDTRRPPRPAPGRPPPPDAGRTRGPGRTGHDRGGRTPGRPGSPRSAPGPCRASSAWSSATRSGQYRSRFARRSVELAVEGEQGAGDPGRHGGRPRGAEPGQHDQVMEVLDRVRRLGQEAGDLLQGRRVVVLHHGQGARELAIEVGVPRRERRAERAEGRAPGDGSPSGGAARADRDGESSLPRPCRGASARSGRRGRAARPARRPGAARASRAGSASDARGDAPGRRRGRPRSSPGRASPAPRRSAHGRRAPARAARRAPR